MAAISWFQNTSPSLRNAPSASCTVFIASPLVMTSGQVYSFHVPVNLSTASEASTGPLSGR